MRFVRDGRAILKWALPDACAPGRRRGRWGLFGWLERRNETRARLTEAGLD